MQIWRFALGYWIASICNLIASADDPFGYPSEQGYSARLAQSELPMAASPSTSSAPGAGLRGSIGPGVGGGDSNFVAPFRSPSASADLSDIDLSRQLAPSSSPRSLSQFASANRSSTAFRPTNIFGDYFGGQNSFAKLLIPITYRDVRGTMIGVNNVIAFNLNGTTAPDLFSVGPSNEKGDVAVAEPLNQGNAYIPFKDNVNGFVFSKGKATFDNVNQDFDITYFYESTVSIPSNISALFGRQKIAENVSPIPQNRIFLNYSYFDNTPLAGGLDVKRWSPGFESLIWNEETSLEVRLPMATTLSSNIFHEGTDRSNHEIGNLYLAIKHIIYRNDRSALSLGCSATLPTADDIQIFVRSASFGTRQLMRIDNEAVHLLPFIGWYRSGDRFFVQGFTQVDIDTNGNSVSFNSNFLQGQLTALGKLQDANFFYFDIQNGYWLRRSSPDEHARGCTGIAAVSEFHWNRSLNAEDQLAFPNGVSFGAPRTEVQVLNALLGMNFEYNYKTSVSVGYATPIGNGPDHEFKGEGRFFYNRFF